MKYLVAALALLFIGGPLLVSNELIIAAQGRAFHLVGSINDKSFLADNTVRNWAAAKALCEQQGMKLAEIESSEEFDLLDAKYDSRNFAGFHWTAGIDKRSHEQFKWNDSAVGVISVAFGSAPITVFQDPGTCLTFDSHSGNSLGHIVPCENPNGRTLCQTR